MPLPTPFRCQSRTRIHLAMVIHLLRRVGFRCRTSNGFVMQDRVSTAIRTSKWPKTPRPCSENGIVITLGQEPNGAQHHFPPRHHTIFRHCKVILVKPCMRTLDPLALTATDWSASLHRTRSRNTCRQIRRITLTALGTMYPQPGIKLYPTLVGAVQVTANQ
jgi:hypothetical protein